MSSDFYVNGMEKFYVIPLQKNISKEDVVEFELFQEPNHEDLVCSNFDRTKYSVISEKKLMQRGHTLEEEIKYLEAWARNHGN